MRRLVLASVWLAVVALAAAALPAPTAASPQIGTAIVKPDSTACLTLRGPLVRAGERIFVLLLPSRIVDGVIVGRLAKACEGGEYEQDASYVARLRYALEENDEVGVAVCDRTAKPVYEDGEIVFYTKGVASPLRFRQCYSSEGEHFSAWRGNRRTWHAYHYLGIELEGGGNCTDEEVGDD